MFYLQILKEIKKYAYRNKVIYYAGQMIYPETPSPDNRIGYPACRKKRAVKSVSAFIENAFKKRCYYIKRILKIASLMNYKRHIVKIGKTEHKACGVNGANDCKKQNIRRKPAAQYIRQRGEKTVFVSLSDCIRIMKVQLCRFLCGTYLQTNILPPGT